MNTSTTQRNPSTIFYIIVIAQFCGTSLWFAANAVLPQLIQQYQWSSSSLAYLTSSTQLGFILGTLVFAVFSWNDKFSPSKIFFICSLTGSAFNLMSLSDPANLGLMLVSRFAVGFALAGVYPVGMKIAADWNKEGLGHWLGALVGALVLGTAFPHSLKLVPQLPDANSVLVAISVLSALGGFTVMLFVPDGPFRTQGAAFSFSAMKSIFSNRKFRAPAFGYFGHMWELYTMWAFIPMIFVYYSSVHGMGANTSLLAFLTIGSGAIGCFVGGLISIRYGSDRVAVMALTFSGVCCVISPIVWSLPPIVFVAIMLIWGITMAADSPQFSALVAKHAPPEMKGSAITIVICIGFAITIVSIHFLAYLQQQLSFQYLFLCLAPGPILGVMAMQKERA